MGKVITSETTPFDEDWLNDQSYINNDVIFQNALFNVFLFIHFPLLSFSLASLPVCLTVWSCLRGQNRVMMWLCWMAARKSTRAAVPRYNTRSVHSDSTSALVKHPFKRLSLKLLNNHAPLPPSLCPYSLLFYFFLLYILTLVPLFVFFTFSSSSSSLVTAPGRPTVSWVPHWMTQCGPARAPCVTCSRRKRRKLALAQGLALVSAWLVAQEQRVREWTTLPWSSCVPRTSGKRAMPTLWMLSERTGEQRR